MGKIIKKHWLKLFTGQGKSVHKFYFHLLTKLKPFL